MGFLIIANTGMKGALQILEYSSVVAAGSTAPPNDFGMVASIDGCELSLLL
jgi:elongator complex protein 1